MTNAPYLLYAFLAAAFLATTSCTSTYRVNGATGALAQGGTARIVVDPDDSGDASCRRAVERELRARGFRVADDAKASLTVKMIDTWRWDIVMYLLELDLVFTDASTGSLRAQAYYKNSPFHGYPSQSDVVEKLFLEMDQKGIFTKRSP
jgi:hypothetical protein